MRVHTPALLVHQQCVEKPLFCSLAGEAELSQDLGAGETHVLRGLQKLMRYKSSSNLLFLVAGTNFMF